MIVPKGVWKWEGTLKLSLSTANSGRNSLVLPTSGNEVEVPVTTIDALTEELGLPRVDYIKMDIEGAEREALRGAAHTIERYRPTLMLEAYHLPDDMEVLPKIVYGARADYRFECGPCEGRPNQNPEIVPHVVYFY